MWNLLNCYLSGRHDFGVTCASGSVFLCCVHCGKRSSGWEVRTKRPELVPIPVAATTNHHAAPKGRRSR